MKPGNEFHLSMIIAIAIPLTCVCASYAVIRGSEPYLTEAAISRFANDLALSDFQRVRLEGSVEAYRSEYRQLWDEYATARRQYLYEWCLSIRPELDESFDLSHLPRWEQHPIISDRGVLKEGGIPDMTDAVTVELRDELNTHTKQLTSAHLKSEQELRNSVLDEVRRMLAPGQMERWSTAIRRLDINIEDQNPTGAYSIDDPRDRVDMLAMLVAATAEDDGELHAFTDALLTPEWVLSFEKNNQDMFDVANRVLAFELSYHKALIAYRKLSRKVRPEIAQRTNQGDKEGAAKLEQKRLDALRRIWNVRLRFAEDMANITRNVLGEDACRVWQRRYRRQFCPVLYLEESTDVLFDMILVLKSIDEDQLKAMKDIYERHCFWRDEFKLRVVRLEIEERCVKLRSDPKDKRGATEQLEKAHKTRMARAKKIYQQLRALLPPEHQTAFTATWEAWRDTHDRDWKPPTVDVRP